jgi:hypothetical protein
MRTLFVLLLCCTSPAWADDLIPASTQLAKEGFDLSKQGDVSIATSKKNNTKMAFQQKKFLTVVYKAGTPEENIDDIETNADGTKIVMRTRCFPPQGGKSACRTYSGAYCLSLQRMQNSPAWKKNLRTAESCTGILGGLDFNAKEIASASQEATGRISMYLGIKGETLDAKTGPPITLWNLVNDFAVCANKQGKWASAK